MHILKVLKKLGKVGKFQKIMSRENYFTRAQAAQIRQLTHLVLLVLIEVYKIFKGYDRVDPNVFFTLSERVSRGHDLKLYKNQAALDIRKYSFSQRVANEWNKLPSCVVDSDSVNNFKGGLDRS